MVRKWVGGLVSRWMLFLILIFNSINNEYVEGRNFSKTNYLSTPHKATVKTIESYEDGDIIDCVDIYKQPAFDNPLIKTLQVAPCSYPDGSTIINRSQSQPELFQSWHRNGECPKGTIPIRRTRNHGLSQSTIDFGLHRKYHSISINENLKHEYAVGYRYGDCKGARATISVWNPKTESTTFSLSQIWITSYKVDQTGPDENLMRTLEAGWIVYPKRYGDHQTRFFIFWTNDNYQKTGCYDLDCPGFVHTNHKFSLGMPIRPVSSYNGDPYETDIEIFKDNKTGNCWLQLQGERIGYWPSSIGLGNLVKAVEWGGEIVNLSPNNHHTTTQMGSGHFSSEKFRKSSYFGNIAVLDSNNKWLFPDLEFLPSFNTNPNCYDLNFEPKESRFYYGGPGYNPENNCT